MLAFFIPFVSICPFHPSSLIPFLSVKPWHRVSNSIPRWLGTRQCLLLLLLLLSGGSCIPIISDAVVGVLSELQRLAKPFYLRPCTA